MTFKDATSVHGVLKGTHHVIDNKKVDPKPAQVKFTTDPQVHVVTLFGHHYVCSV